MADILPVHYHLHLEPNFHSLTFLGETRIELEVKGTTSEINLHALDLAVEQVLMKTDDTFNKVEHSIDLEKQTLSINCGSVQDQSVFLKIVYKGEINDKLVGFYQSKFTIEGEEQTAAVTQFQESDARRAFPCIDEPGKKATFDIEYLIDPSLFAISNMPIKEERKMNGKKLVIFERTPKMSTYLVFFGIGDFESIETTANDKLIRLLASPGKPQAYGEFGLDFGVKTLQYCEDYYDIEYPIAKMDLIATPDFAHGAMENWGAILFRENLLLNYPGVTSQELQNVIQMVIAHEIAHQWFGNLVTPATWKYLWLNESFATFFGFGVVDHYYPEKKMWEYFVQTETAVALGADGRVNTASIEVPGEGVVGMTIKTAPILYNKGGSVLRQVEAYLGKEMFREGLRSFLKKYAFSTATSNNLWEELEEVSNQPINKMMESWILQEGYPLISVTRDGNTLHFSQRRFTYLDVESSNQWIVPISVQTFGDNAGEYKYLLDSEKGSLTIPDNFTSFKLNTDHTGFYRVAYEKSEFENLGKMIREKSVSALDRFNIENDLYGLVRSLKLELEDYLAFLANYQEETEDLPISSISGHLRTLNIVCEGSAQQKIAASGLAFCESVLERIGYLPQEGEPQTIASLRGQLLTNAYLFGSEITRSFILEQLDVLKSGGQVSADILGTVITLSANITNDFDYYMNGFENAENEQMSSIFTSALGLFSNEKLISKVQEEIVFEKIPGRNRMNVIGMLNMNPKAKETMWHWFLANLDNFEALHPFMYQQAISGIIPNSAKYEQDVKQFFSEYTKKKPEVQDAVDVGLENMQINGRMSSL